MVLAAPVVQGWKAKDGRRRLERPEGLIHFKMHKATELDLWHLYSLVGDDFHSVCKDAFKLTGMSVLLCGENRGCLSSPEHP